MLVQVDPRYFRPAEVDLLLGDPTKAANKLGWTPRVGFRELVEMMVEHDSQAVWPGRPGSDPVPSPVPTPRKPAVTS